MILYVVSLVSSVAIKKRKLTNNVPIPSGKITRGRRPRHQAGVLRQQGHAVEVQHHSVRLHDALNDHWIGFHSVDFVSLQGLRLVVHSIFWDWKADKAFNVNPTDRERAARAGLTAIG